MQTYVCSLALYPPLRFFVKGQKLKGVPSLARVVPRTGPRPHYRRGRHPVAPGKSQTFSVEAVNTDLHAAGAQEPVSQPEPGGFGAGGDAVGVLLQRPAVVSCSSGVLSDSMLT